MRRADTSAGEHGDGCLRHHRHVERHKIALADTHGLEGIRGFADLGMQLAVGEATHVAWLAFPDQCRFIGLVALEMSIQTVVGDVGGATFKPARKRRIRPIED
ncbi:MAG: Uncharacterised protein [Synechococcus sp. MIT S9220]|nr:MAG: Uncharacterised protein [Synechococcus sp. MIT S9220]